MVRVASVFWASSAPIIMPAIRDMRNGSEFDADKFVTIGSGVYAGGVGSFVAVKKRGFGILVQGVTLGYIVSDMTKAFVMAEIIKTVPEAAEYIDWLDMIFTFALGVYRGSSFTSNIFK